MWEIAFASEEYYTLTGLTEERVAYFLKSIDTMENTPKETQLFAETIRQLAKAPERLVLNSQLTGQDGKLRDIRAELYSFMDKNSNMQIYGHLVDMTEHNRKQELIHIREEEGRAVLD